MKKEYDLEKMKKRPGKVKVDKSASKSHISIRLDIATVVAIKAEAGRLGIGYQTLIGSILHRFATGELVDKKHSS